MDIDQNNQKDKKKLKPGLENFLPPDAARKNRDVTMSKVPKEPETLTGSMIFIPLMRSIVH